MLLFDHCKQERCTPKSECDRIQLNEECDVWAYGWAAPCRQANEEEEQAASLGSIPLGELWKRPSAQVVEVLTFPEEEFSVFISQIRGSLQLENILPSAGDSRLAKSNG